MRPPDKPETMRERSAGGRQRLVSPDLNMQQRLRSGGREATAPTTPYRRRKTTR